MTAGHRLRLGAPPLSWSVAALALAILGVVLATWLILSTESDPSQVRWPLVVLPAVVSAIPVLVPSRGVRVVAAVTLAAWCVLATLSIGYLLWPAFAALVVAAVREDA